MFNNPRLFKAWLLEDVKKDDVFLSKGTEVYAMYITNMLSLTSKLVIKKTNDDDIGNVIEIENSKMLYSIPLQIQYYIGKFHNGDFILYINSKDSMDRMKSYEVIGDVRLKTIKDVFSENWKSNAPMIPENTVVNLEGIFTNFYGMFFEISYNGRMYDVKGDSVDYLGKSFELDCN